MGDPASWRLPDAKPRARSVTRDWNFVDQRLCDGVAVHEIRNVPTGYGYLTEVYRTDWSLDSGGVDQVFQSVFEPGEISAWHAHELTTDRLFVTHGRMLIVLFDSRPDSPTSGQVDELRLGALRPAIVSVPPKVWHGVANVGSEQATLLNVVDRAYQYERPDHLFVEPDSPNVPYDMLARVRR